MLSANISVYNCTINGNQGHSALRAQASSHIFLGKINDRPAQYHSVGVSKTAIGNVLWRNTDRCLSRRVPSQPRRRRCRPWT